MLPSNPFPQLVPQRAVRVVQRLEEMVWKPLGPVDCEFGGSFKKHFSLDEAVALDFSSMQKPFFWGQLFDQAWFRLRLPDYSNVERVYLHWKDQGEGTLYLGGVPTYGFDVAHRRCRLPGGVKEAYIEGLCLQSAIWHPDATGMDGRGSRFDGVDLCQRDEQAWHVLHDFKALLDLAIDEGARVNKGEPLRLSGAGYLSPVHSTSVLFRRLLKALDNAADALDAGGLEAAGASLVESYSRLEGQAERITAVLTGHAHIDLVWLWPESCGEYKAVHTFSTMQRLLNEYPEFRFAYSQPFSYRAVEKRSPALMNGVRESMREGRWECLGATDVESDTQLPCGEGLLRSFLLGQRWHKLTQGKISPVLWIPDVFGYAGCLPQIMSQVGVKYFFTTKLTWSNIHLFPYSSFVWRGIDGSEVLAHVTQENGYNQQASAVELRRGANAYRQSDVDDAFLAPTGFGDGGGGVTEEMCERARRYRNLAGMPETRWGGVVPFFERLAERMPSLPVYQGELYLEYHRGVFTTHGDLKAVFRNCERALQTWEAVRCATGGGEVDEVHWRRLVFAQFHDFIPGSSIREVYEMGIPELAALAQLALRESVQELASAGEPAVFNPLPVPKIVLRKGADGCDIAHELAPLSGSILRELPALKPVASVCATPTSLSSAQVSAEFDEFGRVAKLRFGDRQLPLQSPLAQFAVHPDYPTAFEAWDIDRQSLSLGGPIQCAAVGKASGTDLEASVEFFVRLTERSSAVIKYRLDAFLPILHICCDLDWQDEHTLLRLLFPTSYSGRMARFGIPFGSVLRGQQPGNPQDEAAFESPASRWAMVLDDSGAEGLGLVTEAKYGFSCRDGMLGVSLVRSPYITGSEPGASKMFPKSLRRSPSEVCHTDVGRHCIRLAVCLQTHETPRDLLAPTLADSLFTNPVFYTGAPISAGLLSLEGGDSLVPCWAKPASDGKGWILRLHETLGRRGVAKPRLAEGWSISCSDVFESTPSELAPLEDISFTPFQILTMRLSPRDP